MLTLLDQLDKGTLWRSPGGIHPPEVKSLSNTTPIGQLPLASTFLVPVPQVGENCTLIVKVGDKVLKGAALTQGTSIWHLPVHAPTSGTIVAIEPRVSNHASALPVNTCVIKADGNDTWCELAKSELENLSNPQMIDKIRSAGIAGMGGAAFPSHIKLNPVSEIDVVIINGVECEPYISADDRLMREYSHDILAGIGIIHRLLTPKRIIIAIEDNKPEAINAMQTAVMQSGLPAGCIRVTVIPTKYPSGGEKQLIQIITGREVPSGAIPAKLGIVVHNVGTAFAIYQAVAQGKPLIERVVTVTGKNVGKAGNYWIPIGTPVEHVLATTEFTPEPEQKVIIGGPMMGHALANIQVPILKGTNCILVPSSQEIGTTPEEKACIRCGECAIACPALLLPQQLFWHAKAGEYDKAASFNLKDCIECGCCSYVCPSDIPLVEYYRIAKSALKHSADEKQQAERAKQRFDARLMRLEEEKIARETKAKEAAERRQATMTGTDKNAVAEAMARIAAKKAAAAQPSNAAPSVDTVETTTSTATPKNQAVAAAIARAKAKKAAQQLDNTPLETSETAASAAQPTADTDKKAKVAAAVARAKAKKAAQQAQANTGDDLSQTVTPDLQSTSGAQINASTDVEAATDIDDAETIKKAKVAAAVARAKAKKAALMATEPDLEPAVRSESTLKPEAVVKSEPAVKSESVEHVQTKVNMPPIENTLDTVVAKAETLSPSAALTTNPIETAPLSSEDLKKARIAATIAKAKAKKVALAHEATTSSDSSVSND